MEGDAYHAWWSDGVPEASRGHIWKKSKVDGGAMIVHVSILFSSLADGDDTPKEKENQIWFVGSVLYDEDLVFPNAGHGLPPVLRPPDDQHPGEQRLWPKNVPEKANPQVHPLGDERRAFVDPQRQLQR
ncbi:hypothetical protein U1Q18_032493 [Sarracenia purpurea var. burkii]